MLDNQKNSERKQKTLIFLCWILYTFSYVGRYSYKSNIVNFGISDTAITGLVMTFFYGAYGIGQVINGVLCSKYNKKIVLPTACIISALCNFAVGLDVSFEYIKYLWLVNGISLSFLYSSIVLVLSENLEEKFLKTATLILSTTVPIGTFLVYGISAIFSIFTSYHATFWFAGVGMLVVAVIWFTCYQKNLSSVKITVKKEVDDNGKTHNAKIATATLITVIVIALFAVVCNLIKDGVQTWTPSILKAEFGLGDTLSTALTLLLPVIGVFGSVLALQVQKKVGNYIAVLGIFFMLSGGVLTGVMLMLTKSWIPALVFLALATLLAQAINNTITSIVPLQLRKEINSGLLAGILNGCCYVGSTISGYGLGALVEGNGGNWNVTFWLLIALCIATVIISAVFLLVSFIRGSASTND